MNYPSNLTDSQWEEVQKIIPERRRRKHSLRLVINALLYIVKTGCQWRMLPHDFPKWQLVYYYFIKWRAEGSLEALQEHLAESRRRKAGRSDEPSVAILDAQTVRSTAVSSLSSGFDAAKRTKGRKRHIVVDSLGLLLCVVVHSAGMQDRHGALLVLLQLKSRYRQIMKVFADGGYAGRLIEKVKVLFNYVLEIVSKKNPGAFEPLPKRWIVERTFAWLDTNRRMSKDYERYTCNSEAMTQLAAIRINLIHF